MNEIEPHVRAELPQVGVVLQQRVEKHPRRERVPHTGRDERRQKAVHRERQGDVASLNRSVEREVV